MNKPAPAPKTSWSWRSQAFRSVIYQLLAIATVAAVIALLTHNTLLNMAARGIQSGFDFLTDPAGFDIGETPIPYESTETYIKAFFVGLVNTLRVAVLGIILTTLWGTLLGIGRFSRNALIRGLCLAYVEFFRNVPVLIQLLMWYFLLTHLLPDSWAPWQAGSFFLSKGGLTFPEPVWAMGHATAALGLLAGVILSRVYLVRARQHFEATGQARSTFWLPLIIIVAAGLAGWLAGGAPMSFNAPIKGEFAVEGGASVTPEFLAVTLGLTVYTSAFVAEVVRAGIQSVHHGQAEAAAALGLNKSQEMRLIMLPQALRVIIPPVTNQYLNLTKNSSLAVAVGYPDIVSVTNTALNQTGRAVECIAIVMLVYLTTSLSTSAFMNWYNKRSAIMER
jgi:general L-amino acid transport system permease protein